mgnify:FL=1
MAPIFVSMSLTHRVVNIYLKSQLHVSLAFCALAWLGAQMVGASVSLPFLGTAFLGTALGYWALKFGFTLRSSWWWFLLVGACVFGWQLNWSQQLGGGLGLLMVLIYGVPLGQDRPNLRNGVGRWKVYWVALSWAWGTAVWPVLGQGIDPALIGAIFGLNFLWVLILMIPFEITDMASDPKYLKTWPMFWGWRPLIRAGMGAVFLWCVGMCLLSPVRLPVFVVTSMALIVVLRRTRPDQPRFWVDFWVEGLPVLPVLLWMLWDYVSLLFNPV